MVRRSKHSLTPYKVLLSLPGAAVLCAALAGATLIPKSARAADLRLPTKPAVQQETPLDWQKRRYEEFLRFLKQRNQ